MHNHLHSKYFEATIQLRPFNKEVFDYIMNHVKVRKNVFISEIKELKTGVDIYLSDKRFAKAIGKKLKQYFKGELKRSYKLHTVSKTGENLYRDTILFRIKQ